MSVNNTEIFAIVEKKSGEIHHKKFYHKLSTAKSAFSHLSVVDKPNVVISRFIRADDLIDGTELFVAQQKNKALKLSEREKEHKQYKIEQATRKFQEAQIELNNLLIHETTLH